LVVESKLTALERGHSERDMILYIAIGVTKYSDIDEDFRVFEANNDTEARHYIINHFDCSLDWSFVSNKTVSLGSILGGCARLLDGRKLSK
tara:strand:+ start:218 stop:490 length:273 start_codon:yes stop_codon:yes gene_type:complete